MMEKIKENSRALLIILAALGVLAFIVITSNSSDQPATDNAAQTETTQETDNEESDDEEASPAEVSDPIGSLPSAGPVVVTAEDSAYSATVRAGDNQTVVVRQIINEFLADQAKTLSAAQRLYIETNLVNELPRSDTIFAGQEVSLSGGKVGEFVQAAEALTGVQVSRWAAYL